MSEEEENPRTPWGHRRQNNQQEDEDLGFLMWGANTIVAQSLIYCNFPFIKTFIVVYLNFTIFFLTSQI